MSKVVEDVVQIANESRAQGRADALAEGQAALELLAKEHASMVRDAGVAYMTDVWGAGYKTVPDAQDTMRMFRTLAKAIENGTETEQAPYWKCPSGHWDGKRPAKTWNGYIPCEACPVCDGAVDRVDPPTGGQ